MIPGDLVRLNDLLLDDKDVPAYGIILEAIHPVNDVDYADYCDWWILRDGILEPWPEHELELE